MASTLVARRCDFSLGHPHADFAQVHAVVAQSEVDQAFVLVAAHALDDLGDRLIDVGGRFALGSEKRAEAALEIRRSLFEPQGHGVWEA